MKKNLKYGAMLLAVCTLATGCSDDGPSSKNKLPDFQPIDLPAGTRSVTEGENDFAFKLLDGATDGDNNCIVSPYSVFNIFGMLAAGDETGGEVQKGIIEALGIPSGNIDDLKDYCRILNSNLSTIDSSTTFVNANSVWTRNYDDLNEQFKSLGKEIFDCEFYPYSDNVDIMNWVSGKTSGFLNFDQSDCGEVNEQEPIFVNALYFKSRWAEKFDPKNSQPKTFHHADGSSSTAMFMYLELDAGYMETSDLCGVELMFGSSNYSFIAIRCKNGYNIPEIDYGTYKELLSSLKEKSVIVSLPKFKIDAKVSLSSAEINALGLSEILKTGVSNIFNDSSVTTQISTLKNKIKFEINEEGAEAAAVYISDLVTAPGSLSMNFNCPFIYLLRERSTNTILFIGRQNHF